MQVKEMNVMGWLTLFRYFGRARELPGVKELFESSKPRGSGKPLESRADLRKLVDASYYGYSRDEEDGELLEYEAEREKLASQSLLENAVQDEHSKWQALPGDVGDGLRWTLPTLEEVQEELVERRRRRLLDKLG